MKNQFMITPRTPLDELPQFLTVEEWQTFMRLGRSTAYSLIRLGIVPAVRWGRAVRISKEAVLKYLHQEGQAGNGNGASVDKTEAPSSR